jgi:hypothetical protein
MGVGVTGSQFRLLADDARPLRDQDGKGSLCGAGFICILQNPKALEL